MNTFKLFNTVVGYATEKNAQRALDKALAKYCDGNTEIIHYVIAVNQDGRYLPVVIGKDYAHLAHHGICVAG